jgi:hypothetical protein
MPHSINTCDGFGNCLTQTDDVNCYGKLPDVTCTHGCQPIDCPNYAVCGNNGPKWYMLCHHGRCTTCDMRYGKNLPFKEEPEECPVCMETSECVMLPKCGHTMCVQCFKRCVDGPPRANEPRFPYPDKEDEYFDQGNEETNPLFHDPLVVKYNADWNLWEDEWNHQYDREHNLRACPMCRTNIFVYDR